MNSGELKVNVPLATAESESEDDEVCKKSQGKKSAGSRAASQSRAATSNSRSSSSNRRASPRFNLEQGAESVTGSLEDLVNSFDEKLSKVFQDYQEQVDQIAPVQVRSQEEIMNECQVWWTITGNFGNMMPIDWSKSMTRSKHLATLNLNNGSNVDKSDSKNNEFEEDDDIIAADLDMHSLILRNSNPNDGIQDNLVTADDVIKEIDDMIEDDEKVEQIFDDDVNGDYSHVQNKHSVFSSKRGQGFNSMQRSSLMVHQALAGRKLEDLSSNELTQMLNDIEILVKDLSEELVSDLGVRDELEFEKELKNTFISLLLSIQSKRRQHVAEGGHRTRKDPKDSYKYLTTVIPYQPDKGAPPLSSLQVLVKILKAINEDSPAVPALLTDYILKVLCPS